MKKFIYTFIVLLAIVGISNKANAQSTGTSAYTGAEHNYNVAGLDEDDSWTFIVTLNTEDPYNGGAITPVDGTEFDFETTETGTATAVDTDADVDITWNTAGDYRIWIKVQDEGTGCFNYRFVDVNVVDNDFNVVIVTLGTGDDDDAYDDISAFGEDVADCPAFLNEEFDDEESDTEGSTYAYYKVTRTVTNASTSDWSFTPAISGTATVTAWESSVDGINWSVVTTITDEFTVDDATGTSDNVWFRATVTNETETSNTLIFNYGSSAVEETGSIADQDDSGSNTATLTLSPLPQIGTFTFN